MEPKYFTAEQIGIIIILRRNSSEGEEGGGRGEAHRKTALGLLMEVLRIYRPKITQNIVYNGHKRAHGIKFQSLALSFMT